MNNKIIGATLITLSIICVPLSAALFTPAVFFSLLLMCVAGIYGFLHRAIFATTLLCFGSLAVTVSPIELIETPLVWIVLPPYLLGFDGTVWGLRQSKKF